MTQHSDPWYYLLLFRGDVLCMYEGNHAVGSMPDSDMRALTPCKRKNSPREHLLGLTSLQESHPGELLFGLVSMQKSPPSELLLGPLPDQQLCIVQNSIVQHSIAKHSTEQHSTASHSIA